MIQRIARAILFVAILSWLCKIIHKLQIDWFFLYMHWQGVAFAFRQCIGWPWFFRAFIVFHYSSCYYLSIDEVLFELFHFQTRMTPILLLIHFIAQVIKFLIFMNWTGIGSWKNTGQIILVFRKDIVFALFIGVSSINEWQRFNCMLNDRTNILIMCVPQRWRLKLLIRLCLWLVSFCSGQFANHRNKTIFSKDQIPKKGLTDYYL